MQSVAFIVINSGHSSRRRDQGSLQHKLLTSIKVKAPLFRRITTLRRVIKDHSVSDDWQPHQISRTSSYHEWAPTAEVICRPIVLFDVLIEVRACHWYSDYRSSALCAFPRVRFSFKVAMYCENYFIHWSGGDIHFIIPWFSNFCSTVYSIIGRWIFYTHVHTVAPKISSHTSLQISCKKAKFGYLEVLYLFVAHPKHKTEKSWNLSLTYGKQFL